MKEASSSKQANPHTTVSGLHHVTLIVDDHERAAWFYGKVLGLSEIPRYDFKFPGLFYHCGDQEVHLIVASRPVSREQLFIQPAGAAEMSVNFIHRHIALAISNWASLQVSLRANKIRITFSEETVDPNDDFANNLIAGWKSRYGSVPVFCLDPFDN